MDSARFTLLELMVIESVLTPSALAESGERQLPVTMPDLNLLLKVGGAILECQSPSSATDVVLTRNECLVIRERVSIFTVLERASVGLTIKQKVYALLRAFAAESELGTYADSDHEEPTAKQVKEALDATD